VSCYKYVLLAGWFEMEGSGVTCEVSDKERVFQFRLSVWNNYAADSQPLIGKHSYKALTNILKMWSCIQPQFVSRRMG